MKTYLCGGINGLSDAQCNDWRQEAKSLLDTETLDPMARDYRGKEAESINSIVEGDISDILACDFILVNASRPSWGTAMEVVYAKQYGKRTIAFVPPEVPVSPWLAYHCKVVRSLQHAIDWINVESEVREYKP